MVATATAARQQAQTQTQVSTSQPTAETPLLDQAIEATIGNLDNLAERYSQALMDTVGHLRRAMLTASAIQKLRHALSNQIMDSIMALMNSPLGFKTDRPNKSNNTPYQVETVRDCVIAGLLYGVFPVNNEINIISGQLYIAQAGYRRLVRETPGLSDLELFPGVPLIHNGTTSVRFGASWKYNGATHTLRDAKGDPGRVIPVTVNAGMGADAIIGKATRKALKAIYELIHGSEHSLPDGEVDDAQAGQSASAPTRPPEGRTRVAPRQDPAPEPVSDIPEKREIVLPDGEVVQYDPSAESQETPPESNDANQMAVQDTCDSLANQIRECESTKGLEIIGRDMVAATKTIGQDNYDALQLIYRERYKALKQAKQ